jgi:hypothetical protein
VQKIVTAERQVYGEYPTYEPGTYTFIADYLPWANGDGMEHRNSTIITSSGAIRASRAALLGTVAHEFFHNWNVERIRPKALEPFDFERANMSGELWLAEGFTQYYGPLSMSRAAVAEFRQVSYYQAVWHAVPSSYVCDGDGVPTKLMRAIGCLNDDTWMGFARNTVRFDPPEFRRYLWPIWTDEAVGGAYMYDITLNIAVFDPPASVVSPLRRGWNLFPWARGGGSGGGPGWYTAQRSDGTYYLPEIDLDTIFDHWAKP